MAYFYLSICFATLYLSLTSVNAIEAVNGKVKITVGTASGCGDTVRFITTQLAEAYQEYRDFLEVEFVPWGRTRYEVDGSMWCQFGPNDCWANRVHRCALSMLEGDQDAQVDYMICEFSSPRPAFLQGSYQCAQTAGINLIDLDHCVTTAGRPLDDAAEEAAKLPMEIINFVPTIHFNDFVDVAAHNQARTRLTSMICFALADDPDTGVTSTSCQI